ncbi:YbhB/YbcL family Raf kinase inhibitor-like protein [Dinghuibacter silviterrae]|uniref:PBP family phospholipid-binding protein n=1 Tax=Dinghuibacter silviterrae TaxID=1539049 RepID=A0A4R8DRL4_9BACT|nr:YbhB/YbcL family Raf kinase inhibitor-like protein [Dinghuibacter silviterrae]TDX00850.1 PBP family phospholipid-binding protein [Dinghuibacter silviterrae]
MKQFFFLLSLMVCVAAQAQTFTLRSNELGGQATNRQFFSGFGCHGDNVSPQLSWTDAPAGTQAFAVTMYDKDAPTGSGFWHWVVFNIPANVLELKSGAGDASKGLLPAGAIQSVTDFGKPGYGGPCPPPGTPHQYLITVYALKNKLNLDASASPAFVGFNLHFNMLAEASIVMYGQQ